MGEVRIAKVEENISIAEEKEEVPMEDVKVDENQDIDHSGSLYKGTEFKVFMTQFMWLSEVNSYAKVQSNKTGNINKPIEQKSYTQNTSRQIFTGHRCSPNKTSDVYEKTSSRSDLRWKPTEVPIVDMIVMTSMIELESLFGPLFNEYYNEENQVVSKSSVVTTADASDKRQ
nr:hypothetical protein [Tanacetum cinerariifolium]